jgi:hypothetical protein
MSTYFADHHRQGFFREKNKKQKIRKKRKRKAEREKWRSAAVFSFVFSSEKNNKVKRGENFNFKKKLDDDAERGQKKMAAVQRATTDVSQSRNKTVIATNEPDP